MQPECQHLILWQKKKLKTCTIYEQPQNSKILNTILAYQITTKTLVFNTKKYK